MVGEACREGICVPVLVTGFNRPDCLKALLGRLLDLNVKSIYVSLDGPRESNVADQILVDKCRKVVDEFSSRMQIQSHFHDTNLGCGRAMSDSITWFFSNVEEGIILEDDILPGIDFFNFCQELLHRYRNDPKVFAVSGYDLYPGDCASPRDASYRFSSFTCVWGWATWRRSWQGYEFDIVKWRTRLPWYRHWRAVGWSILATNFWAAAFDQVAKGTLDTWDYQLVLSQMLRDQVTATPNGSLVENHGFGPQATHTSMPQASKKMQTINWPLRHPKVKVDSQADNIIVRTVYGFSLRVMARHMLRRVVQGSLSCGPSPSQD